MNILPGYLQRLASVGSAFLAISLLLAAGPCEIAGQTRSSNANKTSSLESHFAAAQEAQKNKDYATAEREYRAALAIKPDFAEVHMNLGLVYQLEDHIWDAMTEFRRALRFKPELAGANFFLGVDYCKAGEAAKAIPYLKAATREEPKRPDIWSWLATAQEMAGEIQAELVTLGTALELQPQNLDLLYLLGHTYEQLGKAEATELRESAPGSPRTEQLLAESYAASSEWPSAVIHFQNALARSPSTPRLHVELGEVLLRAGKVKQAAGQFEDELRFDPGSLPAIVRRGEAKLVLDDVEGSLLDWQDALDRDKALTERILGIRETGFGDAAFEQLPDAMRETIEQLAPELQRRSIPSAHLALAFLAVQNGDNALAAAESAQAVSSGGTPPFANFCSEAEVRESVRKGYFSRFSECALGLLTVQSAADFRLLVTSALFEAGHFEAALKALSGLALPERHSPEASYWRARCYEKLATAAYLSLYQTAPNSYRVHQLMGDLNAAKGDDRKAIEEYRQAIALKSSLPNLHYSLGHLLWKDLKVNEAREEFEAELALNPGHGGALNELGDTYLLDHQPDKALHYLNRALAADPRNPDIHRDMGTAYSELRDYRKAEAQFKVAVSADRDGSVHYKLARVYQALGEKEKAAREFELSTALNAETHRKLEKQRERLDEVEKSTQDP